MKFLIASLLFFVSPVGAAADWVPITGWVDDPSVVADHMDRTSVIRGNTITAWFKTDYVNGFGLFHLEFNCKTHEMRQLQVIWHLSGMYLPNVDEPQPFMKPEPYSINLAEMQKVCR